MRSSLISALAAVATTALAQEYNQTGGFTLQIKSDNATLDGQYLGACHEGAAIEGLCLAGTEAVSNYNTFFLNYTQYSYNDGQPTGLLIWNLPYTGSDNLPHNESESLIFQYSPNSNVVVPQFFPGNSGPYVSFGFDADDKLFVVGYFDDSNFQEGVYPNVTYGEPLYNWHACYTYTTGYYYHAVAWVTTGKPTNPTCKPVTIVKHDIA